MTMKEYLSMLKLSRLTRSSGAVSRSQSWPISVWKVTSWKSSMRST